MSGLVTFGSTRWMETSPVPVQPRGSARVWVDEPAEVRVVAVHRRVDAVLDLDRVLVERAAGAHPLGRAGQHPPRRRAAFGVVRPAGSSAVGTFASLTGVAGSSVACGVLGVEPCAELLSAACPGIASPPGPLTLIRTKTVSATRIGNA